MEDSQTKPTKKKRKYSDATLKAAIENMLQTNMSLYRASKEYKIPWSTLKDNLERVKATSSGSSCNTQVTVLKMGRPYALSADIERQIISYIHKMQELGFGLKSKKIKQLAYTLAEAAGEKHNFSSVKQCAGKHWWVKFRERFALSLRVPENRSARRVISPNSAILEDFYDKLVTALVQHNLMDCLEKIWNCDEIGLTFINKSNEGVTKIEKKTTNNEIFDENGTKTTVLACINAAGCSVPPMVIFKGVRNIPELSNGSLPGSLTRLSRKGSITASLFLEWLKFFAKTTLPTRPVMLIMDSHASYVSASVLDYAKSEQIVLFTMSAHTSHVPQPLDAGVFHPLKQAWQEELQNYKYSNPNSTPTRFDFQNLLAPAYTKSVTASNIRAGFEKAGIYPLNRNAICPEAVARSKVANKAPTDETTLQEVIDQPAGCSTSVPSTSGTLHSSNDEESDNSAPKRDNSTTPAPKRKKLKKSSAKQKEAFSPKKSPRKWQKELKLDDDWICTSCGSSYSDDVSLRNGADWITCSFCLNPYHSPCQTQNVNTNQAVFTCHQCSVDPDDSASDF